MVGRLPAARTLAVRRGYEFARLQQQLLSLAYEQLLPIVRPPNRTGRGRLLPDSSRSGTGCRSMNKEVPDHVHV